MAQVRLDADVEEALRAVVADEGGSLAQQANRLLRATLAPDHHDDPPAPAQARLGRPRHRVPR